MATSIEQTVTARGIKKDWLASRMGIDPSYFARVLHGRAPFGTHLFRRAVAVLLEPPYLEGLTPELTRILEGAPEGEEQRCIRGKQQATAASSPPGAPKSSRRAGRGSTSAGTSSTSAAK